MGQRHRSLFIHLVGHLHLAECLVYGCFSRNQQPFRDLLVRTRSFQLDKLFTLISEHFLHFDHGGNEYDLFDETLFVFHAAFGRDEFIITGVFFFSWVGFEERIEHLGD